MLVNVKIKSYDLDYIMKVFKCDKTEAKRIQQVRTPEILETGIYLDNSFNFEHKVNSTIDYAEEWGAYGVCDNIEQIKAKYKHFIDDKDKKYVIGLDEVIGKNESPQGGWRWHKWGTYIGDQEPQCEYLYDEPKIEKVLVFTIFEVKE